MSRPGGMRAPAALLFIVVVSTGTMFALSNSATSRNLMGSSAPKPLSIKLSNSGVCSVSKHDVLTVRTLGFAPNSRYVTIAFYPQKSQFQGGFYTYLLNHGIGYTGRDGSMPNWSWDCTKGFGGQPDPVGSYRLIIVDVKSGRSVGTNLTVVP